MLSSAMGEPALAECGKITAWGHNFAYQCDVPAPNSGFAAVAAGGYHSLGIKVCQYKLAGDFNDDCEVDLYDFAEMAPNWLIDFGFSDLESMAGNWLIDCNLDPNNPACVAK